MIVNLSAELNIYAFADFSKEIVQKEALKHAPIDYIGYEFIKPLLEELSKH